MILSVIALILGAVVGARSHYVSGSGGWSDAFVVQRGKGSDG